VARKRVASKLGLQVSITSVRSEAVLGGVAYLFVHESRPRMVIRLLCMMIGALRCAGIAYFYGMMRSFFLVFVPLFLSSEYFSYLFPPCALTKRYRRER
jgi:hypothetical protein